MKPCCRNSQCSLGKKESFDILEINRPRNSIIKIWKLLRLIYCFDLLAIQKKFQNLLEMIERIQSNSRNILQLIHIFCRDKKCRITMLNRIDHTRQKSTNWLQRTIKSKFPKKQRFPEKSWDKNMILEYQKQKCHCHRQVKTCPNLFDIRRRQIQNKLFIGNRNSDVSKRRSNPFFGFFNSRIRQSNNFNRRNRIICISFDNNFISLKP